MADCLRLGCGHDESAHVEETRRVLARTSNGCQWTDATTRRCTICTCSNFSAKVVDRRGLWPGTKLYNENEQCSARTKE